MRQKFPAPEALEAVAALYVPAGYTVEHRKSLTGYCSAKYKLIRAPRPRTLRALQIFLHECAHIHLKHSENRLNGVGTWEYLEEMEAERWTLEKMTLHGISIPVEMTRRVQRYVAFEIAKARLRGVKRIDPAALEFVGNAYGAVWQRGHGGWFAETPCGRYVMDGEYDKSRHAFAHATGEYVVWWHPCRGKPERVGRAFSARNVLRLACADYEYRFWKRP